MIRQSSFIVNNALSPYIKIWCVWYTVKNSKYSLSAHVCVLNVRKETFVSWTPPWNWTWLLNCHSKNQLQKQWKLLCCNKSSNSYLIPSGPRKRAGWPTRTSCPSPPSCTEGPWMRTPLLLLSSAICSVCLNHTVSIF